jgi:hypothetical protein
MPETDSSTVQVVQAYYDILTGGMPRFDPARLRAIPATDLVFEGPIAGHAVGAERFSKGVTGFIETREMVKSCGRRVLIDHAATFISASSGRSTSAPFSNLAPARTRATRCGPLT